MCRCDCHHTVVVLVSPDREAGCGDGSDPHPPETSPLHVLLPYLHPVVHPHLPGGVGRPLPDHHHHPGCQRGQCHVVSRPGSHVHGLLCLLSGYDTVAVLLDKALYELTFHKYANHVSSIFMISV